MDLSALAHVAKKHSTGSLQDSEKRWTEAENYYLLGLLCLQTARQTQFADKELCLKACDLFLIAIVKNRKAMRPYMAMGYLMMVFQNPQRARYYLKEAQERSPLDPDVLALLAHCKKMPPAPVNQPLAGPSHVPQIKAFQQLDSSSDHGKIQQLNRLQKDARQSLAVPSRLVADTDEPSKSARWDTASDEPLSQEEELAAIQKGIQGLIDRLPALQRDIETVQCRADLEIPERMRNALLDMCDGIADRLDELETADCPVQPLIYLYEILAGAVEGINDVYDEFSQHLAL